MPTSPISPGPEQRIPSPDAGRPVQPRVETSPPAPPTVTERATTLLGQGDTTGGVEAIAQGPTVTAIPTPTFIPEGATRPIPAEAQGGQGNGQPGTEANAATANTPGVAVEPGGDHYSDEEYYRLHGRAATGLQPNFGRFDNFNESTQSYTPLVPANENRYTPPAPAQGEQQQPPQTAAEAPAPNPAGQTAEAQPNPQTVNGAVVETTPPQQGEREGGQEPAAAEASEPQPAEAAEDPVQDKEDQGGGEVTGGEKDSVKDEGASEKITDEEKKKEEMWQKIVEGKASLDEIRQFNEMQPPEDRLQKLMDKLKNEQLTEEELQQFEKLYAEKAQKLLDDELKEVKNGFSLGKLITGEDWQRLINWAKQVANYQEGSSTLLDFARAAEAKLIGGGESAEELGIDEETQKQLNTLFDISEEITQDSLRTEQLGKEQDQVKDKLKNGGLSSEEQTHLELKLKAIKSEIGSLDDKIELNGYQAKNIAANIKGDEKVQLWIAVLDKKIIAAVDKAHPIASSARND